MEYLQSWLGRLLVAGLVRPDVVWNGVLPTRGRRWVLAVRRDHERLW
jgi:hypothetical protein